MIELERGCLERGIRCKHVRGSEKQMELKTGLDLLPASPLKVQRWRNSPKGKEWRRWRKAGCTGCNQRTLYWSSSQSPCAVNSAPEEQWRKEASVLDLLTQATFPLPSIRISFSTGFHRHSPKHLQSSPSLPTEAWFAVFLQTSTPDLEAPYVIWRHGFPTPNPLPHQAWLSPTNRFRN